MRLRLPTLMLVTLASGLVACSSARALWPWGHRSSPPAQPVRELQVTVPPDAQVPIVLQFWERNTLVVDLTGVAAKGAVELRPGTSGQWPVRIALRFQPGRFEVVEAMGAQRIVIPVTEDRQGPATVELPPAVNPAGSGVLKLTWGPKADY
jgi:hypothetical protein